MLAMGSLRRGWRVLVVGVVVGVGVVAVLPAFSVGADLSTTLRGAGGALDQTVHQTVPSVIGGVPDTLRRVGVVLPGGGGAGSAASDGGASPRANVPPGQGGGPAYQPPLHGAIPDGQGTLATVGLTPAPDRPYSGSPAGGSGQETVVVGRTRGEQRPDGSYHGHVTIAALLGNEILGADTNPGQTNNGPFNGSELGDLSEPDLAAAAMSGTDRRQFGDHEHGLDEPLEATRINVPGLVTADAGSSNGNISTNGSCQTGHGDSQVANANLGGATGVGASAASSSSDSTACAGTAPTQSNRSSAVLSGSGALAPVQVPAGGCGAGTPNTQVVQLPPLASGVCNADDSNASTGPPSQTSVPYGVREALAIFAVSAGGTSVLRATTAAAESHAVAQPTCPAGTTGTPPNCVPTPCPAGTTGTAPNCVPISCPAGEKRSGSKCVPISCPAGEKRSGSKCVPISCPAGERRSGSKCVRVTCPPHCPSARVEPQATPNSPPGTWPPANSRSPAPTCSRWRSPVCCSWRRER